MLKGHHQDVFKCKTWLQAALSYLVYEQENNNNPPPAFKKTISVLGREQQKLDASVNFLKSCPKKEINQIHSVCFLFFLYIISNTLLTLISGLFSVWDHENLLVKLIFLIIFRLCRIKRKIQRGNV